MIYLFLAFDLFLVLFAYREYRHEKERERLINLLTDAKDAQIRQAGGTIIPSLSRQPRLNVEPPSGWFDRKSS